MQILGEVYLALYTNLYFSAVFPSTWLIFISSYSSELQKSLFLSSILISVCASLSIRKLYTTRVLYSLSKLCSHSMHAYNILKIAFESRRSVMYCSLEDTVKALKKWVKLQRTVHIKQVKWNVGPPSKQASVFTEAKCYTNFLKEDFTFLQHA